jgi:hypothetical protein
MKIKITYTIVVSSIVDTADKGYTDPESFEACLADEKHWIETEGIDPYELVARDDVKLDVTGERIEE